MAADSISSSIFNLALYFSSDLAFSLTERLKLPDTRWIRGLLQCTIFSVLMLLAAMILLAALYCGLLVWSVLM